MPGRKRSVTREGSKKGTDRNRGARGESEGPQVAERVDGDAVPGGRRAARGLLSHLAERTGHPHIRGGLRGIEQGLPKHRGVEVHKPPPHPLPQAEKHSARAWSGLDPVAPKDLAFSKVSEGSSRPQAPRQGFTPGERGEESLEPSGAVAGNRAVLEGAAVGRGEEVAVCSGEGRLGRGGGGLKD